MNLFSLFFRHAGKRNLWKRFKLAVTSVMDFKSRIWVVNIHGTFLQNETFFISEDNFKAPLQWMRNKQYTEEMLEKVESMKIAQVISFVHGDIRHRLVRVK